MNNTTREIVTDHTRLNEMAMGKDRITVKISNWNIRHKDFKRYVPKFYEQTLYVCTGIGGSIKRRIASAEIVRRWNIEVVIFHFED